MGIQIFSFSIVSVGTMWTWPTYSASLGRISSFCWQVQTKSSEGSVSSSSVWGRQRQAGRSEQGKTRGRRRNSS